MLHKIEKNKYPLVQRLFAGLEAKQPMCSAVLAGIYPGRIYVDDPASPASALLLTYLNSENETQWGFLAGSPTNDVFSRSINRSLFNREIISDKVPSVLLTLDSPEWENNLPQIFGDYPPIKLARRQYTCQTLNFDWASYLPRGFSLERLEASIFASGIEVPGDLKKTLAKWTDNASPQFKDFGVVILDRTVSPAQVAAWSTVDFVVNDAGDIGLFTQEKYRRRGLAKAASGAALEHGLAQGLKRITWTCAVDNLGSIRIAEKLGLERQENYSIAIIVFDKSQHIANLAYYKMEAGLHAEAANLFEDLISSNVHLPDWTYFDAACAWAVLGQSEKAFGYLNYLIQRGWKNPDSLEFTDAFDKLKNLPEWGEIMKKIYANQNKPD